MQIFVRRKKEKKKKTKKKTIEMLSYFWIPLLLCSIFRIEGLWELEPSFT
jgi:hypothetical protein